MIGIPTPPTHRSPPKRMVQFAACEGFYMVSTYFIGLLGGLGILVFLSNSWTAGGFFLLAYPLLILAFSAYAERKRATAAGFVISFSRTNTTILCDIFVQTVRVSVISILVDLIGNQKIASLFNEREFTWYQGRL